MNIEEQVCSLSLAKRLKELGVEQDTLTFWASIPNIIYLELNDDGSIVENIEYIFKIGSPQAYGVSYLDTWSAFTSAELGEMLPDLTESVKRSTNDWVCIHKHNDINDHSFAEKEADARAKMLIFLLEKGLIKND